jgi:hypothetical protein
MKGLNWFRLLKDYSILHDEADGQLVKSRSNNNRQRIVDGCRCLMQQSS